MNNIYEYIDLVEFDDFIKRLAQALLLPLPGKEFQIRMSSMVRIRVMLKMDASENAIKSSVLVLLYPGEENRGPTFVAMLRPKYNGIHSGQISLPGGRYEPGDDNLAVTALRETYEEVGMDPEKVKIIGKLTELYIPPSNYIVQPFVGYTSIRPRFTPQPEEVEKIIEVPVRELIDEKTKRIKRFRVRGLTFRSPAFVIDGNTIWGATAMILNEFKEIVRRMPQS